MESKKKRIWALVGTFLIILSLVVYFLLRARSSPSGAFTNLNFSTIIFIVQWVVIAVVGMAIYFKVRKQKKLEKIKMGKGYVAPPHSKSETDMDSFYDLLQEKKSLSTGIISRAFKIEKDKALEWMKILEDQELISIEYPAFGDPEAFVKGYKEGEKKLKEKEKLSQTPTPSMTPEESKKMQPPSKNPLKNPVVSSLKESLKNLKTPTPLTSTKTPTPQNSSTPQKTPTPSTSTKTLTPQNSLTPAKKIAPAKKNFLSRFLSPSKSSSPDKPKNSSKEKVDKRKKKKLDKKRKQRKRKNKR